MLASFAFGRKMKSSGRLFKLHPVEAETRRALDLLAASGTLVS
jgi:hypothetical protein